MHNQYPDIELRESLAAQMGVPESRIQVNIWKKRKISFNFQFNLLGLVQESKNSSSHSATSTNETRRIFVFSLKFLSLLLSFCTYFHRENINKLYAFLLSWKEFFLLILIETNYVSMISKNNNQGDSVLFDLVIVRGWCCAYWKRNERTEDDFSLMRFEHDRTIFFFDWQLYQQKRNSLEFRAEQHRLRRSFRVRIIKQNTSTLF